MPELRPSDVMVGLRIRIAVTGWLIEQLVAARGSNYQLLPIYHGWDKPVRSPRSPENLISGVRLMNMKNKFANRVAARNWMKSIEARTPWDDGTGASRVKLSVYAVSFKPYDYHDSNPSLLRTAIGMRILEEIEKIGEICGHEDPKHRDSFCEVLTIQPGYHEGNHHNGHHSWKRFPHHTE